MENSEASMWDTFFKWRSSKQTLSIYWKISIYFGKNTKEQYEKKQLFSILKEILNIKKNS